MLTGIMSRESLASKRSRCGYILARLREAYPQAATELDHKTPFELLVATMLSAQATDRSVNEITPELFARFPDAKAFKSASTVEVEAMIRSIGLFRTKARNLIAMANQLVERHGGEVPADFDALLRLPGVGRKTANVVLANAFKRPAIAVDTHVARLARRLGLTGDKHPDRIERDLQPLFAADEWIFVHHAFILHGRRVCTARRPRCGECVLSPYCPSSNADLRVADGKASRRPPSGV